MFPPGPHKGIGETIDVRRGLSASRKAKVSQQVRHVPPVRGRLCATFLDDEREDDDSHDHALRALCTKGLAADSDARTALKC